MRAELGDDEWVAHLAAALGHPIGSYRLIEEVGRGSQGVVYRARDEEGDQVAIKLLHADGEWSQEEERRLSREVGILERLTHPGIVRLLGIERTASGPALVFDWVEGQPIDQWVRGRDLDEIVELGLRLCHAIEVAHDLGVVHRDLKPSNILVEEDGTPRVLDFGIARSGGDSVLTRTGAFVGSEAYASPEQRRGEPSLDVRSDVFALGLILHELLTGVLPTGAAHPGLPEPLRDVLDEALERDPRDRYRSAGTLARDLERVLEGAPVRARPRSVARHVARWSRGRRITMIAVALVGVLLVALARLRSQGFEQGAAQADLTLELASMTAEHSTVLLDGSERQERISRVRDRIETLSGADRAAGELILVQLLLDDGDWIAATEAVDRAEALHADPKEVTHVRAQVHIRRANATGARLLLHQLVEDAETPPSDEVLETSIRFHLSWGDWERAEAHRILLATRQAADIGTAAWRRDRHHALLAFRVSSRHVAGLAYARTLVDELQGQGPGARAVGQWILGLALMDASEYRAAIEAIEGAVALHRAGYSAHDHSFTATLLTDLGQLYQQVGRRTEAEQVLTEAMLPLRPLRREYAEVALLAQVYRGKTRVALGRVQEGFADLERAIVGQATVLGPHHPDLSYTHEILAAARASHGEHDRARLHLDLALTIRIATLGPDHRDVASLHNTAGGIWYRAGRADLAQRSYTACLEHLLQTYPGPSFYLLLTHTNLAAAQRAAGDTGSARQTLARASEVATARDLPLDHPDRRLIEIQQLFLELSELQGHLDRDERTAALEQHLRELDVPEEHLQLAREFRARTPRTGAQER